MKTQILHIANLDQVTDVSFPWSIVVMQVLEGSNIYYTVEMHHQRFVRPYKIEKLVWPNEHIFANWLKRIFSAWVYDNRYYPIELFDADLNFAKLWFARHFMRKRDENPVAI